MALPKGILEREHSKFVEDITGKVAVRTYDTALIELNANYTQKLEYSGANPVYLGLAAPGSATSDSVWQIRKLTYSGDNVTAIEWADGNDDFDNVWDDRSGLSYS